MKKLLLILLFPMLAYSAPYKGWERLANKLIEDGINKATAKKVFESESFPEFDFVPFRLAPKESSNIYQGFLSYQSVNAADTCLQEHGKIAENAAQLFGVQKELLISFLFVETRCGKNTGSELVANRLSRVSNVGDEVNLRKNYIKLLETDSEVIFDKVRDRSKYLEFTFYPEILRLFQLYDASNIDILTLKGSVAGAFGLPQFLPRALWRYGIDGDKDGKVDLFNFSDAIYSVAYYMASNGWKDSLSDAEKRKVIWHYNRSEPYIETILRLTESLK